MVNKWINNDAKIAIKNHQMTKFYSTYHHNRSSCDDKNETVSNAPGPAKHKIPLLKGCIQQTIHCITNEYKINPWIAEIRIFLEI